MKKILVTYFVDGSSLTGGGLIDDNDDGGGFCFGGFCCSNLFSPKIQSRLSCDLAIAVGLLGDHAFCSLTVSLLDLDLDLVLVLVRSREDGV